VKVFNVEEYKEWQGCHPDTLLIQPAWIRGKYATVINLEQAHKGRRVTPGQTPARRALGYSPDAGTQIPGRSHPPQPPDQR